MHGHVNRKLSLRITSKSLRLTNKSNDSDALDAWMLWVLSHAARRCEGRELTHLVANETELKLN